MDTAKDNVWLNFERMGNATAKCKICGKTYSVRNSVTLSNHLERSHDMAQTVTPHQLFVTSTTPITTEEISNNGSSRAKAHATLSENSDTDTQNNSQTANNTESSDVEPRVISSLLDEAAKDKCPRTRSAHRRRMKRPSLRGSIRINTDEDFGRLISKKMQMLPFAIRCGLEVDILRMVNGALNKIDEL